VKIEIVYNCAFLFIVVIAFWGRKFVSIFDVRVVSDENFDQTYTSNDWAEIRNSYLIKNNKDEGTTGIFTQHQFSEKSILFFLL